MSFQRALALADVPEDEAVGVTVGAQELAIARHGDEGADHAVSTYRLIDQLAQQFAWMEFEPYTGRTHQLRVHAAQGIGMPIVGDPVYGRGGTPMLLHARALRVDRGAKPAVEATAPAPPAFDGYHDG